jgi:CRP-like cAMP-binding protein
MSDPTTLRKFPQFTDWTDAHLEVLQRVMVEKTFPRGHVFVREGEQAHASTAAMYLILDGNVEVSARHPQGGFGVLKSHGPGQIFGMIALMDDGKRSATCTAISPVRAAVLTRFAFKELYRSHMGVTARFQFLVARQLAHDIRQLDGMLRQAFVDDSELIDQFTLSGEV